MVAVYAALIGLVAIERLVELGISRRNQAWALERGGIEFGADHFPWMSAVHTAFLVSCVLEVWWLDRPFIPWLAAIMLVAAAAAQTLRYWAIATLGSYWNVRVIVVPQALAVDRGPYRYLRHPNYLAVGIEMIAIPMIHTAMLTAVVFSLLNAWILSIRIRCEEDALRQHEQYDSRLGDRRRFLPGRDATRREPSGS